MKNGYWYNVWNDLKKSKFTRLGWFISGTMGSVIAWFVTDNGQKVINWDNAILVGEVVVGWYMLVAINIMIKHLAKYLHNTFVDSLYGAVIANLTELNWLLKEQNKAATINDNDLMNLLKKVCNDLKQFFDKKTHSKCGVSIKVTLSKDNNIASWKFRNLCRDDKSVCRDTEQYKKADHTVVGNTPYSYVVNQLTRHSTKLAYINNNIPESKGYLNTSKVDEDTILPYKSELVFPIMPLKNVGENPEMCGFLCVDCDKIEKFDEKRYDVSILESIIDNLYELLIKTIDTPTK